MAIDYNANTFNLAKTDIKKALTHLNVALSDSKTVLNYIPNDLINKNKLYTSKTKINDVLLRTDTLIKFFVSSESKFINANSASKFGMGQQSFLPVTSLLNGSVMNMSSNISGNSSNTSNIFEQIGSIVTEGTSIFVDGFGDLKEDLVSWGRETNSRINQTGAVISNGMRTGLEKLSDEFTRFFKPAVDFIATTGATIVSTATSILKGVLSLGESIVDFGAIVTAAAGTPFVFLVDQSSRLLGKDSKHLDAMWENTMNFVSTKHVQIGFDKFYNENDFGIWINDNSMSWFKNGGMASNIIEGIGYVGGTIALTILTGGIYGAVTGASVATAGTGLAATVGFNTFIGAGVAATAGFGRGAETAWGSGADLLTGLGSATLNGLLEGTLWYIGGRINVGNFVPAQNILGRFGNALAKSGLETLTGAVEFPVRVLIDTLYLDNPDIIGDETFLEKLEYSWNKSGGAIGYATNVGIAGFSSIIGEGLELGLAKKTKIDIDSKTVDIDINTKPKVNYSVEQKIKNITNLIGESDDRMYDKIHKFTNYLSESTEAGNINSKNLLDTLSETVTHFDDIGKPLNISFIDRGFTYFAKNTDTLYISIEKIGRELDDTIIKKISSDLNFVLEPISNKLSKNINSQPKHIEIPAEKLNDILDNIDTHSKYLNYENNIELFGSNFTKSDYDQALRIKVATEIENIVDASNFVANREKVSKMIDLVYSNQLKSDPSVYFSPDYQRIKKLYDHYDSRGSGSMMKVVKEQIASISDEIQYIKTQSIDDIIRYNKLIDENAILPKNEFLNLVNTSLYKNDDITSKQVNYIMHNLIENRRMIDDISFDKLLLTFTNLVAEKNNVTITSQFKNNPIGYNGAYFDESKKIVFSRKYINQKNVPASINTALHELQHAVQFQKGVSDPFYRAQILKDKILHSKLIAKLENGIETGYYESAYKYISYEIDARYVAYKDTLEYLKKYAPSSYEKSVDAVNREMAREISIMNIEPTINIDGIMKSRSELFDELILGNTELVNSDLQLYLEYNSNGTRKSLESLKSDFNHYKNSTDPDTLVRAEYLEKLIDHRSNPIQKMDISLVKNQFFTDENGKIVKAIIEGIEYNVK